MFNDSLFKKIENKTNVSKETILSMANKLQNSDMKDEKVLNDLIDDLSKLTGKSITDEKKHKIIDSVIKDKIPNNIDNML